MRKLSADEEKEERAVANLVTWRRISDGSSAIVAFGALCPGGTWRAKFSRQSTRAPDFTKRSMT